MAQQETALNVKLLLIGDSSVGKSSLLLRFSDEQWLPEDEATATIGVDFRVHKMDIDGRKVKLSIWDTAGQERFRTITASYYRGAQGVILVYDVTNRESFEALPRWLAELDTYVPAGAAKVLVGNKVDKAAAREIPPAEGAALAARAGALFVEASAKTAEGVREVFTGLVAKILENERAGDGGETRTDHGRGGVPGGVQVVRLGEGGGGGGEEGGGCAC
ncbi:ras-domain-containing protein [Schizophyllum fasciatum]